jgi:predicted O-linked N-acetylglucosamine transferase (SPINDLY family)
MQLHSHADLKKTDKIRIGYVSSHLGNHPIGHVTRGIFKEHDRGDFDIYAYSLEDRSNEPSGEHRDIKAGCDSFTDISSLSPVDAARRIASDGISILVDLAGYMSYENLNIFSYRPAPVQVYWLGHGGGLGLSFIDYVIADTVVIPPGDECKYKEKILRLPEIYHSTDTPPISETRMQRSDQGLAENAFVYCAFNSPKKIDRKVFDAWMNILHRVPASQLWLSRPHGSELLVRNLRREAQKRGVDPDRLVFASRTPDKSVHLARHRLADLFLDTFSYNASTTAIDTLWAGLPILTCRGDTFYSRICTSMLTSIGLQDMICDSIQAYEDRAVYFAQNGNALAEVRERLARNRMSHPLFDVKRFVRHLEAGYREIWKRFQENQPPQNVNIPPLP